MVYFVRSLSLLVTLAAAGAAPVSSAHRSGLTSASIQLAFVSGLHCNHNLKKTFSQARFDYFSEKPIKAVREIRDICPYLQYTCCSLNEIEAFRIHLSRQLKLITRYHEGLKDYFRRIAKFNAPRFLDNFERLTSGNFPNCHLIERPESLENTIATMVNRVPQMLQQLDRLDDLILRYYSGFLCTMCDPEDHAFISVNSENKMQMIFNVAMCSPLLHMKKMHHEVILELINQYIVADAMACLYIPRKIRLDILFLLKSNLEKRIVEIDNCLNLDDTRPEVYTSAECVATCSERVFFQQYISSHEVSAISEIGYKMMALFDAEIFEMTEDQVTETLHQVLDADSPNFFRRYFDIWHSHSQNAYDDVNFEKVITFRGINFFDNKVRSWAGRAAAVLAWALLVLSL